MNSVIQVCNQEAQNNLVNLPGFLRNFYAFLSWKHSFQVLNRSVPVGSFLSKTQESCVAMLNLDSRSQICNQVKLEQIVRKGKFFDKEH
jgi:hypothetical protein